MPMSDHTHTPPKTMLPIAMGLLILLSHLLIPQQTDNSEFLAHLPNHIQSIHFERHVCFSVFAKIDSLQLKCYWWLVRFYIFLLGVLFVFFFFVLFSSKTVALFFYNWAQANETQITKQLRAQAQMNEFWLLKSKKK